LDRRPSLLGLGAGQVSCAVVWVRGRGWVAVVVYSKHALSREACAQQGSMCSARKLACGC
jgi:hypothetical protein